MKKLQLPKEELLKIIKEELSQIMVESDQSRANTEINPALQRDLTKTGPIPVMQRPESEDLIEDLPRVIGVIFEKLKILQAKVEALESNL
tara:strand:- start:1223 stop:1492 length:270 start_codon:yes stop_codon:yes gene_type:complete